MAAPTAALFKNTSSILLFQYVYPWRGFSTSSGSPAGSRSGYRKNATHYLNAGEKASGGSLLRPAVNSIASAMRRQALPSP